MTRLLILDFDGTFTDAHAEAKPFLVSFKADLADLLGRNVDDDWDRITAKVRADPTRYGWQNHGHISAPAGADPYLTASCVAQNMFDEVGILQRDETRNAVLQTLYSKNYALTASVPRPDARRVLEELLARDMTVAVVTNSHTATVKKKIDDLGLVGAEKLAVYGDARKFVIDASPRDPTFDGLSDLTLPGLDTRKVLVKRGHYYDLLNQLWRESGTSAAETLVCGDIFELDLALPLCLGCRVHLVHRDETPSYEVAYIRAHPLGSASEELSGVLDSIAAHALGVS